MTIINWLRDEFSEHRRGYLALYLVLAWSASAIAETVNVKYRGDVDLVPFQCEDVSRSSFIHRVCYGCCRAIHAYPAPEELLPLLRDRSGDGHSAGSLTIFIVVGTTAFALQRAVERFLAVQ